jgi:hypothetical protein
MLIRIFFLEYLGGGVCGSGPQTDKILPQSPFTCQFFRWRHYALPMGLIFLQCTWTRENGLLVFIPQIMALRGASPAYNRSSHFTTSVQCYHLCSLWPTSVSLIHSVYVTTGNVYDIVLNQGTPIYVSRLRLGSSGKWGVYWAALSRAWALRGPSAKKSCCLDCMGRGVHTVQKKLLRQGIFFRK